MKVGNLDGAIAIHHRVDAVEFVGQEGVLELGLVWEVRHRSRRTLHLHMVHHSKARTLGSERLPEEFFSCTFSATIFATWADGRMAATLPGVTWDSAGGRVRRRANYAVSSIARLRCARDLHARMWVGRRAAQRSESGHVFEVDLINFLIYTINQLTPSTYKKVL